MASYVETVPAAMGMASTAAWNLAALSDTPFAARGFFVRGTMPLLWAMTVI